jgi:hypothetical protein
MGKIIDLSAFERGMVVGARRTGLCQALQCCWVFHAQHFRVYIKNGPPPKGHQVNLTQLSTLASITVERFRHLVESRPRQIEAVLRAKRGCNSILGRCSLCGVRSVYVGLQASVFQLDVHLFCIPFLLNAIECIVHNETVRVCLCAPTCRHPHIMTHQG